MAHQADYNYLVKVGLEGFSMLDEQFGKQNRTDQKQQKQQQQQLKYQQPKQEPHMNQAPKKHGVIDCYEAAHLYGGLLVADYSKRKPPRAVY